MINMKQTSQRDRETATADVTVDQSDFRRNHLLLFILASILVHTLGLLIFGVYQRAQLTTKEKTDSKPIEFVVVPPEESSEEPPPETQKRAAENSVAEKKIKPEKTAATEEIGDEIPPRPTNTTPTPTPPKEPTIASKPVTPPPAIPEPVTPEPVTPEPVTPEPVTPEPVTPEPKPEPTNSSADNQSPILSGSDSVIPAPKPEPPPVEQPAQPEDNSSVATRLPPQNKPSEKIPEPITPQPTTTPSEPTEPTKPTEPSDSGAASLLGGNYQRTIADGGGDAFFSPEALAYKSVLNPAQLNALKDIDLSEYFAEIKRRVKRNWNPSFAVEEYTTFLTFDIEKNGQITGLRVTRSSGSEKVDRESLNAVQDSAPFDPLPPDFPLEALEVKFSFNIYIY